MNSVKVIGILAIGAILGYSFSFIGKASNEDSFIHDEVITAKETLPNTTAELKAATTEIEQEVVKQSNAPVIKKQVKTTIIDDKALNQEHLDLVKKHQVLKDKYTKSKNKIASLKHQLSDLDDSEATDEEMEGLAPEPFKSFLSSFRGQTRNDIYDFHKKEDDLDWGFDTQTKISDFIQTHYNGTSVNLISVICKQPHCEILVTEKQEDAWESIMKDITMQPWWTFSSFTSSTRSNAENELSVYAFLKQ
jgi:hypothetical protein